MNIVYLVVVIVVVLFLIFKIFTRKSKGNLKNSLRKKKKLNVVITGGSSGIGMSTAISFLKDGHSVVVCSRQEERAKDAATLIMIITGKKDIYGIKCDVSNPKEVETYLNESKKLIGDIDVLIINAGVSQKMGHLENVSDEVISQVVSTNLIGALFCAKKATKIMQEQKRGGHIVFIEGHGSNGDTGHKIMTYACSKAGLKLAHTYMLKEKPDSIVGLHAYMPGMVMTNLLKDFPKEKRNLLNALCITSNETAEILLKFVKTLEGTGKYGSAIKKPLFMLNMLLYFIFGKNKGRFYNEKTKEPTEYLMRNLMRLDNPKILEK